MKMKTMARELLGKKHVTVSRAMAGLTKACDIRFPSGGEVCEVLHQFRDGRDQRGQSVRFIISWSRPGDWWSWWVLRKSVWKPGILRITRSVAFQSLGWEYVLLTSGAIGLLTLHDTEGCLVFRYCSPGMSKEMWYRVLQWFWVRCCQDLVDEYG